MRKSILITGVLLSFCSYGQRTQELTCQTSFIRTSSLGEMTVPNMYEFGIGYGGGGGFIPSFTFNFGYMGFGYKDDFGTDLKYRAGTYGGTIGFRPIAKIVCSRFQPVIMMNMKSTFKKSSDTDEAKITFFSVGTGCELFISDRWSSTVLVNRDFIGIGGVSQKSVSLGLKFRHYI